MTDCTRFARGLIRGMGSLRASHFCSIYAGQRLYQWRQQVLNDQLSAQPADLEKKPDLEKKKRKKDKVRSAWISFAGRIVGQTVGAVATVALGVTVLHRSSAPDIRSRPGGDPSRTRPVVSATLSRPAG